MKLIINADDFGLSKSISDGNELHVIKQAKEDGLFDKIDLINFKQL